MTTFQTQKPIAITVDTLSGNVTVIASDRTDTVVEVRPADASKKADVHAAEQTRVDFAAGALTVQAPKGWRTHSPFGSNQSIEVIIKAPNGSRFTATAGEGKLRGTGELGECDLAVSAGDIDIDSTRGSVTAKTAKGDIRIGAASHGVVRLETSMGNLEVGIRPGSAARLQTNTQNGTVQNQLGPVGGADQDIVQVFARTSFGNITIGHSTAV
ncbi:DUF4097 family beta strand repeat-containing protein [Nocardia sp. NBC_01388]|uniref:DUF4097 family beta strand repeat-containing protein n=1 Tax=Nocardia sp. NBC_01388 TaxID=2903596 RepID=UPI0032517AB9